MSIFFAAEGSRPRSFLQILQVDSLSRARKSGSPAGHSKVHASTLDVKSAPANDHREFVARIISEIALKRAHEISPRSFSSEKIETSQRDDRRSCQRRWSGFAAANRVHDRLEGIRADDSARDRGNISRDLRLPTAVGPQQKRRVCKPVMSSNVETSLDISERATYRKRHDSEIVRDSSTRSEMTDKGRADD